ncbi:hypothetical protein PVAP13_1NG183019 [Panicum virgatum]|uniref:Uncharacterized protein n=1 Tax=Panicum virgatum TaxID=38727 RepID=A0A8T0WYL2_PANVG|nr:hypothetical protein PVAP13_1NG183019 [Panicum virgatum]
MGQGRSWLHLSASINLDGISQSVLPLHSKVPIVFTVTIIVVDRH